MAAVESPVPAAVTESKSARKKKAKAEAATAAGDGTNHTAPAVPDTASKDNSVMTEADSTAEHPYIKELQKQIRNINKKLTAMHKLDAILKENPGVSLDDLVAQRKINTDQKAAAQKKPQLVAQLSDLEERQEHYRKFDAEYQLKLTKQRDEITSQHQREVDKLREELRVEAVGTSSTELQKKLLIFSQFLRAAAAKRGIEEEQDTEESRAFEGALLLVYGGDPKAVETAVNLIEGNDQQVLSVEGVPTAVTFKQVKQAALDHAPFQNEEAWVDQVAEATGGEVLAEPNGPLPISDPTIAHAGLTELDDAAQPTGELGESIPEAASAVPVSAGDAGNVAGERWDTDATGAGAEKGGLEDSFEMVPRPSEEVDIPVEALATPDVSAQTQRTSWADEPTQEAATGVGNHAGETWDTKAPGEVDNSWGVVPASSNGSGLAATSTHAVVNEDGFSQVTGRHRGGGRGGRGRGADSEGRGRGRGRGGGFRGGRGDGEFRGSRGGGYRGGRGDGEFRGVRGGGRGRSGPRGGANTGTES